MRDLLSPSNDSNLVESSDLGGESAVYAEDFTVHECCQRQEIEDLAGSFPYRGVAVLLLALFIEPVDLGDLPGLVVSSD